ncbi:hypothetical protein GCM10009092_37700 [Bowmanella denitrificans]|uniref:Uncharacterized protein n=1 Tax=Bowmanella denitrificans TaxID=366582 RepID=A0ABN0XQM7_9ALTE
MFSDELALVNLNQAKVHPNPRPVSLKNRSIDIIKEFSAGEAFTPSVKDTIKGTVAHMRPPTLSVQAWQQDATPALIVFPRYQQGAATKLAAVSIGTAFMRLVENSFNYHILGRAGFDALVRTMQHVACFDFVYDGNLSNALQLCDELIADA